MSLNINNIVCNQCKSNISTTKYVKCYKCNSSYHFTPCCSLSEKAYDNMQSDKKEEWGCHRCKVRTRSESNNAYQTIVFEEISQQKKQREDDEESNSSRKKFKDTLTLNSVNSGLFSVQSELKEIKTSIELLNNTVGVNNAQNLNIIQELKSSITTMASSVATLATQVNDLYEREAKQNQKINQLDTAVNKIDQALIKNNIEIKNVNNPEMSANEIIKTIAASIDVEINNIDINNAYCVNKAKKAIIEFTTLNKKKNS